MGKGFGRIQQRRQRLEERKDKLRDLGEIIPWEVFRPSLERLSSKARKSKAGRHPIDRLRLFKLLLLQQLYNLSDEDLEYQCHDRLSFRRFAGLSPEEEVPDATTISRFRDQLTEEGLIDELFEQFEELLRKSGHAAKEGQIIDATLVPVPIQRNSREENEKIKQGEIPTDWAENPHRLAQKDREARWTKKNGISYFGYKNHINIDVGYGFIRSYSVTDASVHDSRVLGAVLDEDNSGKGVWADSAYRSENIEAGLEALGHISHIHERGYRNHPLSEGQIASNREKSKTRAKVEHVFGAWVTSMGGKMLRCIGIERVRTQLGLKNLAYNFKRYIFWQKKTQTSLQIQCA
jgi:IS5 family transposase